MRAVVVSVAVALLVSTTAAAQPGATDSPSEGPASAESKAKTTQVLGARLGMEAGGRTSPGGLRLVGSYLYRLTDADWLDQSIGFGFGGRGAECFRDRADDLICDHGLFGGVSIDLAVGVRRYLGGDANFRPYIRGGIAARGVFFSGDEVSGLSLPLWAGAGIRAQVAPAVNVVADAILKSGFGLFNRGLGLEPQATFELLAGVEFAIN